MRASTSIISRFQRSSNEAPSDAQTFATVLCRTRKRRSILGKLERRTGTSRTSLVNSWRLAAPEILNPSRPPLHFLILRLRILIDPSHPLSAILIASLTSDSALMSRATSMLISCNIRSVSQRSRSVLLSRSKPARLVRLEPVSQ